MAYCGDIIKKHCPNCGKTTKHVVVDVWDPDYGDTKYQRSDGMYERHNYCDCKKCKKRNPSYYVTWHP